MVSGHQGARIGLSFGISDIRMIWVEVGVRVRVGVGILGLGLGLGLGY